MERNDFITRLQEVYDQAENLFNDDKGNEAAKLLKQEIPALDSAAEVAGAIIPWLDATSLLANILLLSSRPTDALEYGRTVYEAAKTYLPGTLEEIYAEELLGNCYDGCGETEKARELWKDAMEKLDYEIEQARTLSESLMKKM